MSHQEPSLESVESMHPRERWFLNALLHIPGLTREKMLTYDQRLPDWDNKGLPLSDIFDRLGKEGWMVCDGEEIAPTEQARAIQAKIAHLYDTLDRPEWRRRLNAAVAKKVQLPDGHPLHRALEEIDRRHCVFSQQALAELDMPLVIAPRMTESALHAVVMTLVAVDVQKGERVLICGAKGGYLTFLAQWLVASRALSSLWTGSRLS